MLLPRQFASLLAALLLPLALHPQPVSTLHRPAGCIADFANALTPANRIELQSLCHDLRWVTHAQLFLVTIQNPAGEPLDRFAGDLVARWNISPKPADRGALVLLSLDGRQCRIVAGSGLDGPLSAARIAAVAREIAPSLKAADYNTAASIALSDLAEDIAADAGASIDPLPRPTGPRRNLSRIFVLSVLGLVALRYLLRWLIGRMRAPQPPGAGPSSRGCARAAATP